MRKAALYGYTDYPIAELGDVSGQEAPIRTCKVLSYDGDKYCDVVVGGVSTSFKAGYIYPKYGRCGEVKSFSRKKMNALPLRAWTVIEKGNTP